MPIKIYKPTTAGRRNSSVNAYAEITKTEPEKSLIERRKKTGGRNHTGWITFHEIAPQLTRLELSLDVEPGGLLEKAARGMRHVKRAARGDSPCASAPIALSRR